MSSEDLKPKRKTHTSSAVKRKYNKKAYRTYTAAIKPDLMERITAYQEKEGLSRPMFLQRAIDALDQ